MILPMMYTMITCNLQKQRFLNSSIDKKKSVNEKQNLKKLQLYQIDLPISILRHMPRSSLRRKTMLH